METFVSHADVHANDTSAYLSAIIHGIRPVRSRAATSAYMYASPEKNP